MGHGLTVNNAAAIVLPTAIAASLVFAPSRQAGFSVRPGFAAGR